MSSFNFVNPYLLLLMIPFLGFIIAPYCVVIRKTNRSGHNIASLVCHIVLVVCATLSVAGLRYERVITKTSVYVLADVSYSTSANGDKVDEYIKNLNRKLPTGYKMGVIAFAKDHALAVPLGGRISGDFSLKAYRNSLNESATDIDGAMRYAGTLFDEDVIKRIIVITDGVETVGASKLGKTVQTLSDAGVYIDAIYLEDGLKERDREVQISGVEYAKSTYLGKSEEARVLVASNNEGSTRAVLTLKREGRETKQSYATLKKGLNTVTISLPTDESGCFDYEIDIETDTATDDTSAHNNTYLFTQTVSGDAKILFIAGSQSDALAGRRIYGVNGVDYVVNPYSVPYSIEDICGYDEIVISNFDVRSMTNAEQFIASIDTAVSKFGKTLTTYGNTYVQELQTEHSSALSSLKGMLPVNIGNGDKDSRIIALILDISISMSYEDRMSTAKAAAESLIRAFDEKDTVMIMGFSGDYQILLSPTELTRKSEAIAAVRACTARNGTVISDVLDRAYTFMNGYRNKEVIIISDGLNSSSDNSAAISVANKLSSSNVVVSALRVMGHDANPNSNPFLRQLVENATAVSRGNVGYFKEIENESDIDYVIGSAVEELQNIKIEGDTYTVSTFGTAFLNGVKDLSSVKGFWYNTAKTSAKTVLTARYFRDKLTSFEVPLFVYWQYGNGKVCSFTSDISLSSNWISEWTTEQDRQFLENLCKDALPSERITTPFVVQTDILGSTGQVTVTTASTGTLYTIKATLTLPNGDRAVKNLLFNSENYVCEFDMSSVGRYGLHIEFDYGILHYETDETVAVSYGAEYDSFTAYTASSLYRLLSETGELSFDGNLSLENKLSAMSTYIFPFDIILMVICAVLFVVDIIIRKLRWQDIVSLFSRKNKSKGGMSK